MRNSTSNAYAGIDVAFAKKKRLPVAVCTFREMRLEPFSLRLAVAKPPVGKGNVAILDSRTVTAFANEAAAYLRAIEAEFRVRIQRIAIDAPSEPKQPGAGRRLCEVGLDQRRIHCISTPSAAEFDAIQKRAVDYLACGGSESHLPGANQLWMLVGFELFKRVREDWDCIEVFPQAIAATLSAHSIHKTHPRGLVAQLSAVARHTGWPLASEATRLVEIAHGSSHDCLDAYLSAWVASLDEHERLPIGFPPHDAIWVPRLGSEI